LKRSEQLASTDLEKKLKAQPRHQQKYQHKKISKKQVGPAVNGRKEINSNGHQK